MLQTYLLIAYRILNPSQLKLSDQQFSELLDSLSHIIRFHKLNDIPDIVYHNLAWVEIDGSNYLFGCNEGEEVNIQMDNINYKYMIKTEDDI